MVTQYEFDNKFDFRKDRALAVGIERECFLVRNDRISPIAEEVVKILQSFGGIEKFGYELSACQLEDRIGPVPIGMVEKSLLENENLIILAERRLGFKRSFTPVAPIDMPLDVYPDPTGRYQAITRNMPREVLQAACRVIGVHVHIGMPDKETALRVYNKVMIQWSNLCRLGEPENAKRLDIYKLMAPDFVPRQYKGWQDFYLQSVLSGFAEDPRSCWHLIRISVHGTIEFRMFPATVKMNEIIFWAKFCHHLCKREMG